MRRLRLLIGVGVLGALTVPIVALTAIPSAHAISSAPQPCGWIFRLSGDRVNVAFPDAAARYWVAQLPLPPGLHAEISGQFPHARYMSFITYDPASRAIDGIHDSIVVPDPGSTNPFVAGADRTVTKRSYTVYLRNEQRPASAVATPPGTSVRSHKAATDTGPRKTHDQQQSGHAQEEHGQPT